jgi:hypothetical protein
MINLVSLHAWSKDALLSKARLYAERMQAYTAEDDEFGLWSALCLELLSRAALANISPALLADRENWRNISYALGSAPTAKRFNPSSIGAKEVFARLTELHSHFTAEMAGFCSQHIDRRNAELHTGDLAFSSLKTSEWLPRFYQVCKVLLASMNESLSVLITDSGSADALITALEDAAAKAVDQDIKAHAQVWMNKEPPEREAAVLQATAWATRQAGHRVECPACKSPALVQGQPAGVVTTTTADNEVTQRQTMMPSAFGCIACGLRISGLSRLMACGLGDAFTAKSTYSAAEFFGLYTEDDLEQARAEGFQEEEDFNE